MAWGPASEQTGTAAEVTASSPKSYSPTQRDKATSLTVPPATTPGNGHAVMCWALPPGPWLEWELSGDPGRGLLPSSWLLRAPLPSLMPSVDSTGQKAPQGLASPVPCSEQGRLTRPHPHPQDTEEFHRRQPQREVSESTGFPQRLVR